MVGLYKKIKEKKDGIYSVISKEFDENGIYLSGGECQRIALARILVNSGELLILDEFNSQLDYKANNEIIALILKLFSNKTIIFVSHRIIKYNGITKIIKINKEGSIDEQTNMIREGTT